MFVTKRNDPSYNEHYNADSSGKSQVILSPLTIQASDIDEVKNEKNKLTIPFQKMQQCNAWRDLIHKGVWFCSYFGGKQTYCL